MKKCVVFVVFIAVALAVGFAFANGNVFRFREAVSNINSTSEAVLEVKYIMGRTSSLCLPFNIVRNFSDNDKVEVDSVFSLIGGQYLNDDLPQCFTNYVNSRFNQISYPTYNAVIMRTRSCIFTKVKPTMDEAIIMFSELSNANWRDVNQFHFWQNWVKMIYFNELKLWFRKNGKSVIEKNGVNPLAPYMEGLMAALNAPRLEGLNQCFVAIGINKEVDLSALKSADEINQMKEDVLMANIDLNKDKKAAFDLMVCLGVDGYNEMVRQYNGEE